jgi:hypothetical protein
MLASRVGMGRRIWLVILKASERISICERFVLSQQKSEKRGRRCRGDER